MLDEDIDITNEDGTKEKKKLSDVIVRKLITKAVKKDDIKAIQEIFDRTEGKAVQTIQASLQPSQKELNDLFPFEDEETPPDKSKPDVSKE
jgi:hypothetical protein